VKRYAWAVLTLAALMIAQTAAAATFRITVRNNGDFHVRYNVGPLSDSGPREWVLDELVQSGQEQTRDVTISSPAVTVQFMAIQGSIPFGVNFQKIYAISFAPLGNQMCFVAEGTWEEPVFRFCP